MGTSSTQVATNKASLADRALAVLREALEEEKLSKTTLDVESTLQYAQSNPEKSVVDSFAAATVLASMDEVFGRSLPREILNHRSLTTLSGLKRSLGVLERRLTTDKQS